MTHMDHNPSAIVDHLQNAAAHCPGATIVKKFWNNTRFRLS